MSASEKLKELQVLPAPAFEPEIKLYEVLPQIVAVVEAAEAIAPWAAERRFLSEREIAFLDALAALEEALGESSV